MPIAPRTVDAGLDRNYNRVWRETSPAERRAYLETYAARWEERAREMEQSADRWAAQGRPDVAGRNLETAREYRGMADEARKEAEEIANA